MFESIRGGNEWSNAVFPLGPHNNFSAVTIKVKRDYTKKVWNGNVPDVFGRWQCDHIVYAINLLFLVMVAQKAQIDVISNIVQYCNQFLGPFPQK